MMNNKMKILLALGAALSLSLLLAGCGTGNKEDTSLTEDLNPIAVRQLVTRDNGHERVIMWQLPKQEKASLLYRKKGESDTHEVSAESKLISGNQGVSDSYIYTADVKGLSPGTEYEYRVKSDNHVSKWDTFTTEKDGNFTAIIFPDSQSSDYSGWKKLAHTAYEKNPDSRFFVSMGDLVDNGQDENQWKSWFDSVSGIIDKIPAAVVLGNHECYSLDWKTHEPDLFRNYFAIPSHDNNGKGAYYSFDWGDVHFAVLDTQQLEQPDNPNLFEEEIAWLKRDMNQTDKKWKVVLMHKDPLQYAFKERKEKREEGFSDEGKVFMPVFDELKIDLVVSAHLHTYRDRGHILNFERSENKGPVYVLSGIAGDVRYDNLWKQHRLDEYVAPQPDRGNYLVLKTEDDHLTLTGFTAEGEPMHDTVVWK